MELEPIDPIDVIPRVDTSPGPSQPGAAGTTLWVPCFVFAQIYAAAFITMGIARYYPKRWYETMQLLRAVVCCACGHRRDSNTAAERNRGAVCASNSGSRGAGGAAGPAGDEGIMAGEWDEEAPTPTLLVRPLTLSWRHLGCTYYNASGIATPVLKVGWGLYRWLHLVHVGCGLGVPAFCGACNVTTHRAPVTRDQLIHQW